MKEVIPHDISDLKRFRNVVDQYEMRKDTILEFLEKENINLNSISAVVGRGGLLRPVPSGIFKINEKKC